MLNDEKRNFTELKKKFSTSDCIVPLKDSNLDAYSDHIPYYHRIHAVDRNHPNLMNNPSNLGWVLVTSQASLYHSVDHPLSTVMHPPPFLLHIDWLPLGPFQYFSYSEFVYYQTSWILVIPGKYLIIQNQIFLFNARKANTGNSVHVISILACCFWVNLYSTCHLKPSFLAYEEFQDVKGDSECRGKS